MYDGTLILLLQYFFSVTFPSVVLFLLQLYWSVKVGVGTSDSPSSVASMVSHEERCVLGCIRALT